MSCQELLDNTFIEYRAHLVDLAAFLDRVEAAGGEGDFRMMALRRAIAELNQRGCDRAKRVLLALSDPTTEPIPAAHTKAACGAWPATPS